jgi:hypothetical protein
VSFALGFAAGVLGLLLLELRLARLAARFLIGR